MLPLFARKDKGNMSDIRTDFTFSGAALRHPRRGGVYAALPVSMPRRYGEAA